MKTVAIKSHLTSLYQRETCLRFENELRKKEDAISRQLAAMEASIDGLAILDSKGKYIYLNEAHAKLYGYDNATELLGKSWRIFYDEQEALRFENEVMPILKTKGQWRGEALGRRADGSLFRKEVLFTAIENGCMVCVVRDLTELKCNVEIIKHMASYDSLTSLPNRLLFNERLCRAIAEASKQNILLAVMFLDLDRFKAINDTLGHNIGDLLIQSVAKRLRGIVRKTDAVSRLGGDEFLLLFTNISDVHNVKILAQKIISELSKPFMLDGREIFVTASVGISLYPKDGMDIATLIKNADSSMYYAKDQGRNNYQFYSSSMNDKGLEQLTLQNNLHKALKQKELLLHYQPQFNLRTGRLTGVEALMRWNHPEFGLVSPLDFIPLAEETGDIVPIGEWLIYTACRQIKTWRQAGLPLDRMSVNLSMRQFQQPQLIEMIRRILGDVDLAPALLELELTESILMHNPEKTIATLRELRAIGIRLSIDDFGTGYSSLNYLKYLPITELKIAQNFVCGITNDPNDEAISKAIITLAHSLSLTAVAEGVETIEQLDFFTAHNCDEVQGFLLGRPLATEDFTLLLIEVSECIKRKNSVVADFNPKKPCPITGVYTPLINIP